MSKSKILPLLELPLFAFFNKEPYKSKWFGLLPEVINIQGEWIDKHQTLIKCSDDVRPFLTNMVNLYKTALVIAGNNRAYFSLYSLRAILERVSLIWTLHSTSPHGIEDLITELSSNNLNTRKGATQKFTEFANSMDSEFELFYDMISQYFAHASKLDGIIIENNSDKDKLLNMRAKALPLIFLFEAGHRIKVLFESLLTEQAIPFSPPVGGNVKEGFKFDLIKFVRLCSYVTCEKHTPKKGVPISTLFKNIKEIKGTIGINSVYRGGMELVRFGKPEEIPEPKEIADFGWYGIGRNHDDKINVKCIKKDTKGEVYRLSWPKSIELDSSGIAFVAAQANGETIDFFDYMKEFIKIIELNSEK
ncbi:hypothetical protein [Maribacter sp. 4U21]|uniref:hypothetical protein n=1 Tax=Maribacter sp. 4U21 TaxID=1889779 RepID=UPI00117C31DD|nr:hypothetical protein [Maribacter sp. 4U21]